MKEITGELWDYYGKRGYIVCITTNGTLKTNGEAVMGRGCAAQAKARFAGIAKILGDQIQQWGNDVHIVSVTRNGNLSSHLIAFPVKHNWWEKADLELIRKSADALHKWTRDPEFKRMKFVLVRAGCGNGGLRWEDVQPILSNLPDCVLVIHPEGEK